MPLSRLLHNLPEVLFLKTCPSPVAGEELPKVLLMHPKLLTFKVGSGKQLQSGKGRAQLDVIETDGQRTVGVSYFRDKTQWATSTPLKPFKPASS